MTEGYKYPWPASALTAEDMAVLYSVREAGERHVHITELIARAVRQTYVKQTTQPNSGPHLVVLPAIGKLNLTKSPAVECKYCTQNKPTYSKEEGCSMVR